MFIIVQHFVRKQNRTRIARIRTDGIIRENPFDPCHPCAFLDGDFCFQLVREKRTADERG